MYRRSLIVIHHEFVSIFASLINLLSLFKCWCNHFRYDTKTKELSELHVTTF